MNAARRIRLKDIADHVGLSVAAVSMALRNDPRFPAATIARVKRVAADLGYRPDPALSALAAHRFHLKIARDFSVIALVSNWQRSEWLRYEAARRLIEGATARGRAYGYTIEIFWTREGGMSGRRFGSMLAARGIRGIILGPLDRATDRVDIDWSQFAVVTIERPVHYPNFHHVVPNYFADTLLAWQQLRARGYRRVGLVIDGGKAERSIHQWEAAHAFHQAQAVAETERVPSLVVSGGARVAGIRDWLRRHRPHAVISRSEDVFKAARAEGLRVPRDFGYVSLNAIDDESGASGILQHRDVMGATAVDVLNSLLHRNHRGPHELSMGTQVDGTWHEGRTLLSSFG